MKLQIADRLAELPFRFRPLERMRSPTWPLSAADLSRISIAWPTELQWPPAEQIVQTLKDGFVSLGILGHVHTPQPYEGVILLHCVIDDTEHKVALDYSDYHDFINVDALALSSLYVKCQFRLRGYDNERIVPGGYIATGPDYYRYRQPFVTRHSTRPSIDVLGRFGYAFQADLRRRAVDLLGNARDLHFVGAGPKVRYSRFIKEAASARLCLHLPGNGPFTHRVVEFLGLGSCMISPRFATRLHRPLVPGVHYVAVADDLTDLVDVCRYYLAHDAEREAIAAAGKEFFDKNLHFEQLASYLVRTMLDCQMQARHSSRELRGHD